ncbi:NAD(P)/FAD-dependent oxidoreductase [Streptomyces tendae]|uniref:NAD(P)/FAD-dependent oxidoreductase n=1 Tax=Streptomyces tendae TaxID=1932 RepID=UPI00378DB06E
MTSNTGVVVIGGGYAGVMAANRLAQRNDAAVTLINSSSTFVERIRLHQFVGGSDDAVVDYSDILAEGVQLRVDTVARIEATERRVTLQSGAMVGYDYLVYAAGSGSAAPVVPGAAEFAHPIASLEEAQRLRPIVDAASAVLPVTVIGSGPTGIEIASELAEAGRKVTIVCGGLLGPYLHPRARRSLAKRFARLGVTVVDGPGSKVTSVARDAVQLSDGRELPSEVTIWAVGFTVPDLAARSGLTTDPQGRVVTDETLTSVDDERIVAAGDSASPSNLPLRMSCQAAIPLGARAADTLLSRMAGEQPAPLNQLVAGQCISLGRGDGIFQLANRSDQATWFHMGGRLAATIKERVCVDTIKTLTGEAHKPGSYGFHRISGGPARKRLLEAKRREASGTVVEHPGRP